MNEIFVLIDEFWQAVGHAYCQRGHMNDAAFEAREKLRQAIEKALAAAAVRGIPEPKIGGQEDLSDHYFDLGWNACRMAMLEGTFQSQGTKPTPPSHLNAAGGS